MPAPAGYSTKIFDDQFEGTTLDCSKWNTYITSKAANGWPWNGNGSGGSAMIAGGFDSEYFEPSQVSVNNGLRLRAVAGSSQPGYQWTSGVVSTYGKFEFLGGYVQVKAKMPSGDGMWPALWTLPGPSAPSTTDNFEIDAFEGGFLGNGVSPDFNYAWHEENPGATGGGVTNTGVDLTGDYHIYGMKWVPGQSITWYLDGQQVGQITSTQHQIANEPLELIIQLAVANGSASYWHTAYDSTTPSGSTMNVAEVQVWQANTSAPRGTRAMTAGGRAASGIRP